MLVIVWIKNSAADTTLPDIDSAGSLRFIFTTVLAMICRHSQYILHVCNGLSATYEAFFFFYHVKLKIFWGSGISS